MVKIQFLKKLLFTLLSIFWISSTPIYAGDIGLVDLLYSQLGVSKDQAEGGAGLILNLAKQNLNAEDFSVIAKAVPGISEMIGAATTIEDGSNTLGSISSMIGGNSKTLEGLAGLASSFQKLGLTGDMVDKFTPIILDYVKNKGGEHAMNLLKGALL